LTLDNVRFLNQEHLEAVFRCTVEANSFGALHTFHRYEELVTKIDPAHSKAKLLKLMIQKILCKDLVSSEDQLSPCIDDVKFVLRSTILPRRSVLGL